MPNPLYNSFTLLTVNSVSGMLFKLVGRMVGASDSILCLHSSK